MLRLILICPGATDFDDQGRIKGTLDMPLNTNGTSQVARTVGQLDGCEISTIYTSPCQSAQQTAQALSHNRDTKIKVLDKLENLDHGLWHGRLIEDVKSKQPKLYRQGQEHPESICPPEGEALASAQSRVRSVLTRLIKKHRDGSIALIVPEPLASMVRSYLEETELGNLWNAECDSGVWQQFEVEPEKLVLN